MNMEKILFTNHLPIKVSEERVGKLAFIANSMLSSIGVIPAGHDHIRCRVRDRVQRVEPQVDGRTENLGPVREALLGWRAGEPPEPVQRLDETKELSPRGLAGGSVALSMGGYCGKYPDITMAC